EHGAVTFEINAPRRPDKQIRIVGQARQPLIEAMFHGRKRCALDSRSGEKDTRQRHENPEPPHWDTLEKNVAVRKSRRAYFARNSISARRCSSNWREAAVSNCAVRCSFR